MGAVIGLHPKKVVPIKVADAANQNNGRINSLKLILKNEPFVYQFQKIVEAHGKSKLLMYNEEIEKLKTQVLQYSDCVIPNTRSLVSNSDILHTLFYRSSTTPASPKRYLDKANQRIENIAIESLQPLLLTEPHENIAVKQYHRLLRSCQHALLLHLLPELSEFLTSQDFQQYEESDVLVYRNIYRQVKMLTSKRGNEEEGSVTAMVECSGGDAHSARTAPVHRLSRRLSSAASVNSTATAVLHGHTHNRSSQRVPSTHRLLFTSSPSGTTLIPMASTGSLLAGITTPRPTPGAVSPPAQSPLASTSSSKRMNTYLMTPTSVLDGGNGIGINGTGLDGEEKGGSIFAGLDTISWKRGPNRRNSVGNRSGKSGNGMSCEEEEEMTIYQHRPSIHTL